MRPWCCISQRKVCEPFLVPALQVFQGECFAAGQIHWPQDMHFAGERAHGWSTDGSADARELSVGLSEDVPHVNQREFKPFFGPVSRSTNM